MARQFNRILGIELQQSLIRVVEMTCGGKPTVVAAAESAMPVNALDGGVILNASAIAIAIRRLVDLMGTSTKEAVIGIPAAGSLVRTLTVPSVPPSELPTIVRGEIVHYGMLSSKDAAHDFFSMPSARTDGSLNVLLVGSEGPITSAIRDVAERAGLTIVALEPAQIGMYRAAAERVSDSSMALLIADSRADVVLHKKGEICLFREIDFGSSALLAFHTGDDPFSDPNSLRADGDVHQLNPARVNPGPANTLAVEIKRSIEFFQREYIDAASIEKLVVVSSDPGIADLIPWLSDQIGLTIDVVDSFKAPGADVKASAEIKAPAGAKYACAYGLAAREAFEQSAKIPHMDLYIHERAAEKLEVRRKGEIGALLASLIVISVGLYFGYTIGQKANHVDHELFHMQGDVEEQQALLNKNRASESTEKRQAQLLRLNGVPLGMIVDMAARRVEGQIGLTDIETDSTGKLVLRGECLDESSAIRSADALKSEPLIVTSGVSSFEKIDAEGDKPGFKFRIEAQGAYGAPPPKPQGGAQ